MRVISRFQNNNITFGRNLKEDEFTDYSETLKEGRKLTGQTGASVLIVPDTCLPQSTEKNTGVGNISSEDAQKFFSDMKLYLGIDTIETLPQGEYNPHKNFYCAYTGTSLSLGKYQINPELLTSDNFGNILTKEEIASLVNSNDIKDKDTRVNFKNIFESDGNYDKILRKAYERFSALDSSNPLKKDFENYIKENNDWLEPKAIYEILGREHKSFNYEKWPSELDKNLYNPDWAENERTVRKSQILNDNVYEAEFYKFKQFLADSHLAIGKENLNKMGLKLKGDCLINFSKDERWAYPKAFKDGNYIGNPDWKIYSLDFEKITDETGDTSKLLKRKIELFAKRYDSIRFDVGWAYVSPKMTDKSGKIHQPNLGENVLQFIEKTVKSVKGEDYDLKNLAYEFEAAPEDFPAFKPNTSELIDPIKNRTKIYGSTYMHEYSPYDRWGSYEIFTKKLGWNPDYLLYGIGNHDPQPLRQIAKDIGDISQNNISHKSGAVDVLARFFNVSQEFLQDPVEFAKAKWAETMQARNMQIFYMDVFGREERFDMQNLNTVEHPEKNYAYKIPQDYKAAYQEGIKDGFGFNPMDALERLFVKNGFDKSHPELYAKIVKYRDILLEENSENFPQKVCFPAQETSQPVKKSNKAIFAGLAIIAALCGGIYALTEQRSSKSKN